MNLYTTRHSRPSTFLFRRRYPLSQLPFIADVHEDGVKYRGVRPGLCLEFEVVSAPIWSFLSETCRRQIIVFVSVRRCLVLRLFSSMTYQMDLDHG